MVLTREHHEQLGKPCSNRRRSGSRSGLHDMITSELSRRLACGGGLAALEINQLGQTTYGNQLDPMRRDAFVNGRPVVGKKTIDNQLRGLFAPRYSDKK